MASLPIHLYQPPNISGIIESSERAIREESKLLLEKLNRIQIQGKKDDKFVKADPRNVRPVITHHFFQSYTAKATAAIAASILVTAVCFAFPPVAILTALGVTAMTFSIAVAGTTLTASFIYLAVRRKEILFEISLAATLKANHHWWNPITPNLVLGAIPLEGAGKAFQDYGITRVLTMNENFELESRVYPIVRKADWAKYGITQKHIPTSDFSAVPIEKVEEGVRYLEEQIGQGEKVYVHCKAGRGRSATIVVAYLMKNGFEDDLRYSLRPNCSYEEAFAFVKKWRDDIHLNRYQERSIKSWYARYSESVA